MAQDYPFAHASGQLTVESAFLLDDAVTSGETVYAQADVKNTGSSEQEGTVCWTFTDDDGYDQEFYCGDKTVPAGETVTYQPEWTHGDLAYELGYGSYSVTAEVDGDDSRDAGTLVVEDPDSDDGSGDDGGDTTEFDEAKVYVDGGTCSPETESVKPGESAGVTFDLINENSQEASATVVLDEGKNTAELASETYVIPGESWDDVTMEFNVPEDRSDDLEPRALVDSAEAE